MRGRPYFEPQSTLHQTKIASDLSLSPASFPELAYSTPICIWRINTASPLTPSPSPAGEGSRIFTPLP